MKWVGFFIFLETVSPELAGGGGNRTWFLLGLLFQKDTEVVPIRRFLKKSLYAWV